jgi:hypothetical protein
MYLIGGIQRKYVLKIRQRSNAPLPRESKAKWIDRFCLGKTFQFSISGTSCTRQEPTGGVKNTQNDHLTGWGNNNGSSYPCKQAIA